MSNAIRELSCDGDPTSSEIQHTPSLKTKF